MSTTDRQDLIDEVARAVAEFQSATDLVDEAASARLGINRTDQRCLGVLYLHGPLSAGRLAQAGALSPGAMTTALDRLERAGYVRRVRHPGDRRSVLVEMPPQAAALIDELYGPIGDAGRASLARYSDQELALLRDFLRAGRALQAEQATRIRSGGSPPTDTDREV